jgi:hypothetical protein
MILERDSRGDQRGRKWMWELEDYLWILLDFEIELLTETVGVILILLYCTEKLIIAKWDFELKESQLSSLNLW